MRLVEALEYANIKERAKKKDLAKLLWPDSSGSTQGVNMSKLISGKTKKVNPDWIPIICSFCRVSPSFLFPDLEF
jgi:hypothetical protein